MNRLRLPLLAAAILTALTIPAVASANTLYVGPALNQTGTCDIDHACSIDHALNQSSSGDTVYVEPGRYVHNPDAVSGMTTVNNSGVFVKDGVTLQGAPGLPRPIISQDAPYTHPTGCNCGAVTALGSAVIKHVRIEQHDPITASAVLAQGSASIEDSEIIGFAGPGFGVSNGTGGHVNNSLIVGNTTAVVLNVSLSFDHDTIIGQNNNALFVSAASGSAIVDVHNSILRSEGSALQDIDAVKSGSATVAVNLDHSATRFATSPATGGATINNVSGNVIADPLFADSNYREAAGSPTVDKAAATATPVDLDGRPFTSGLGPDIGAYEYYPPPPVAGPLAIAAPKVLTGVKFSLGSKLKKGKLSVKVMCPKSATGSCAGTLSVKKGTSKAKTTKVKAIKPGKTAKLKVKAKKGKASITLTLIDASGAVGTKTVSKKLK